MSTGGGFWMLEHLSNEALLHRVEVFVRASRRGAAEVVAQLGEVEERRLHLDAGYGSMFTYCVAKLGMSEDEACRRIGVARLARRFPALYSLLASGRISLSVAALLEPHLSTDTADDLLEAVSGCTTERAREVLAARFPRPDVACSIRKLPRAPGRSAEATRVGRLPQPPQSPALQLLLPSIDAVEATSGAMMTRQRPASNRAATRRGIEPLSAARYKVQFPASIELKNKLELARDLMRHALPAGDIGSIVDRALDLLIEKLMNTRFGQTQRRARQPVGERGQRSARAKGAAPRIPSEHADTSTSATPTGVTPTGVTRVDTTPERLCTSVGRERSGGEHRSTRSTDESEHATSTVAAVPHSVERISRATRRKVLERDGLRCSFRAADGTRCASRAWLEHDHICPRGKGGTSDADNMRLFCRAHNRHAAERHYGRDHIERASSDEHQARARRVDEQSRASEDADATGDRREPNR